MKRKNGKPPKRRKDQRRKRLAQAKRGVRNQRTKQRSVRSSRPTDPRIARALGQMRREGVSASEAARRERMKLNTFCKGAGRFLYRSGPGKPWRARSEDQLSLSMTVLTSRGRVDVIVRNSQERKLLHRYELALRMFRADEPGAEAALKRFDGKKVGGYTLITDTKLLIQLEEFGQLDFESLYTPIGRRS